MNVEEFYVVYCYEDPDYPSTQSAHRNEDDAKEASWRYSASEFCRVEKVYGVEVAGQVLILGKASKLVDLTT